MFKTVFKKLLCLTLLNFVSCQVTTNFTDGTNVPDVCLCATSGQCDRAGGGGESDGSGIINPRVLNTGGVNTNVGTNVSMCQPVSTGVKLNTIDQNTCEDGLDKCCPDIGYTCGVSYPPISGAPEAATGQAPYGAYPHQAAIYSADKQFLGGGALIDQFNVLTAAHIVVNASKPLLIKIGHWDLKASQEPLSRITVGSSIIEVHPNFTASSLKNNIAIIRLPVPVPLGRFPTIGSICLPSAPVSGIRCMLSGWGDLGANSKTSILRHVDLPILNSSTCQSMLRTTKLGKTFVFDSNSFICAGGEKGKDACSGDGGSPLSCYIVDRYYLVGVVSWGIGCGQPGVPGVYTNIFNYIPWIQKTTAQLQNGGQFTTPRSYPTKTYTPSETSSKDSPTTTTVDGKVTKSALPMIDPTVASTEKTVPTTTATKTTISVVSSSLSTIMSTIASTLASTIRSTPSTTASPKVTTMSIISGSTTQTLTSTRSSANNVTSSGSTSSSGTTTSASKGASTNSGTQSTTSPTKTESKATTTTSSAVSTTRSTGAVNSTSSTPKPNVTATTTKTTTISSPVSKNSTATSATVSKNITTSTTKSSVNGTTSATKAESTTVSSNGTGSTRKPNSTVSTTVPSTTLKPTTIKAGNSSTSATVSSTTTGLPSNGTRPGNGTTVKSGTSTTKQATKPGSSTRQPSSIASGGTKTTPKGPTTTVKKGNSTVKGTPKTTPKITTTTKNSNFLGMN